MVSQIRIWDPFFEPTIDRKAEKGVRMGCGERLDNSHCSIGPKVFNSPPSLNWMEALVNLPHSRVLDPLCHLPKMQAIDSRKFVDTKNPNLKHRLVFCHHSVLHHSNQSNPTILRRENNRIVLFECSCVALAQNASNRFT